MAIESQAGIMKSILRVESEINTIDSKAFNLSRLKESKHITIVLAVLNNGNISRKYVKLSFIPLLYSRLANVIGAPAATSMMVIRNR